MVKQKKATRARLATQVLQLGADTYILKLTLERDWLCFSLVDSTDFVPLLPLRVNRAQLLALIPANQPDKIGYLISRLRVDSQSKKPFLLPQVDFEGQLKQAIKLVMEQDFDRSRAILSNLRSLLPFLQLPSDKAVFFAKELDRTDYWLGWKQRKHALPELNPSNRKVVNKAPVQPIQKSRKDPLGRTAEHKTYQLMKGKSRYRQLNTQLIKKQKSSAKLQSMEVKTGAPQAKGLPSLQYKASLQQHNLQASKSQTIHKTNAELALPIPECRDEAWYPEFEQAVPTISERTELENRKKVIDLEKRSAMHSSKGERPVAAVTSDQRRGDMFYRTTKQPFAVRVRVPEKEREKPKEELGSACIQRGEKIVELFVEAHSCDSSQAERERNSLLDFRM